MNIKEYIRCKITSIIYVDDYTVKKEVKIIDKFPYNNFLSDFFHLKCTTTNNGNKWNKYFMRAILDKKNLDKSKNDNEKLNVHIISYDSLSQMAFRRLLPKTVRYFEDEMNGIVLNGYNIVGDGTPQAFIPILTGQTEIEQNTTRKADYNSKYVDEVYNFVWKHFSNNGYVTSYGEDAYNVGTFQYRLNGFKAKPTDHYTRPSFKYTEKIFGDNCFDGSSQHKEWLDYTTSIVELYNKYNISRFSLFHHSALTHDFTTRGANGDIDLYENIKYNFESGNFDNDIVILMADHGHRFAKFRKTYQGQLEERLPFLGISLPKKFKKTKIGGLFYKNLVKNKDTLTSPFDYHESLLDILYLPKEEELIKEQSLDKRGLSFFRPIPKKRSCFDAKIEAHWCTCLQWTDVWNEVGYKSSVDVSSKIFVSEVNKILEPYISLCSPIKLDHIIESKWLIPNKDMINYRSSLDRHGFVPDLSGDGIISEAFIKIKLLTQPNKAIYDFTVLFNFYNSEININVWTVSRINKYGDSPHCIIDKVFKLAPFCVCYDKVVG
uniref:Type I phosphodiesterase / nucleotide pyrophosphatase family protein n=1 Tax=Parastrongyloides trichosuri TaxID=131310 RepID=A0A0N4Z9Q6_PARTI